MLNLVDIESTLTDGVAQVVSLTKTRERAEAQEKNTSEKLHELVYRNGLMDEANKVLAIVNDTMTSETLNGITAVINKALLEIFPNQGMSVHLEKSLYAGKHIHIEVKLTTSEGQVRSLRTQSGTGVRQILSFLFVVCLIEMRGGRRVLLTDEILNGLHLEAKRIISDIITIFANSGFQFIMVEYGIDHLGKIYNVEQVEKVSRVYELSEAYDPKKAYFVTETS